jgi:hypothetical protein
MVPAVRSVEPVVDPVALRIACVSTAEVRKGKIHYQAGERFILVDTMPLQWAGELAQWYVNSLQHDINPLASLSTPTRQVSTSSHPGGSSRAYASRP